MSEKKLAGKKILIIIAPEKFRDEEYNVPFNLFLANGADITVASTKTGKAKGMFGTMVDVWTTVEDVTAADFNAVVFIGGQGTPLVRSDERAVKIAKDAAKCDVVAAICWAPTILAKAGILKGRKATVWLGYDEEYGKKTNSVLEQFGGKFEDFDVVSDGNIITGNGPNAAMKFAQTISTQLSSR